MSLHHQIKSLYSSDCVKKAWVPTISRSASLLQERTTFQEVKCKDVGRSTINIGDIFYHNFGALCPDFQNQRLFGTEWSRNSSNGYGGTITDRGQKSYCFGLQLTEFPS